VSRPPLTPPLKCQGIKTKLVSAIQRIAAARTFSRWVEPFCGSCVVALNVQPKTALLCDANPHIIRLYQDIQSGRITASRAKSFLTQEGGKLKEQGEPFYYVVRERFNKAPSSLDFLFLNRSCFNGVMRFNRKGGFNVPYCHKPERFATAYVTKIANQVGNIAKTLEGAHWTFAVADFRETLANSRAGDFVYCDPPYAGRHADYFNSWSEEDETALGAILGAASCDFLLSTWHSNEFRTNHAIERVWNRTGFSILKREHFYHVGSSEDLRHPMVEALIANFPMVQMDAGPGRHEQPALFGMETAGRPE
jgi:DNA adenine methylase